MSKSRLHNLELVHLNIWLNLLKNQGYRVCSRWSNTKTGYLNFKNDSYKQFLNHVEQYGVYRTFVALQDLNGSFNPHNCFWSIEEQDLTNHPFKNKSKIEVINTNKNKNKKISKKGAKIINLKDFKKNENNV